MDNISLEQTAAFQYPAESFTTEMNYQLSESIRREVEENTSEFINRFLSLILPAKDVRLEAVAFSYACGIDVSYLFNCDNTLSDIAKSIGVSKQVLSYHVNSIVKQFDVRTNTGKNQERKIIYETSNFHKPGK